MKGFPFDHQTSIVVFWGIILAVGITNIWFIPKLGFRTEPSRWPKVSILVPARNESENIELCVQSLLAQDYPNFEVLVLDDHSTDDTWQKLEKLAKQNPLLRILRGLPLPEGFLGKHWACHQLAQAAEGELLLFTDADTRHAPHALRSAVGLLLAENASFLTAFPRQEVVSWGERLTVPMLLFSLFAFFPIGLARLLQTPWLSISIGQFMLFRRSAYEAIGGHEAVKDSPVDDIDLGRLVVKHRLRWVLADASGHVSCRMYRGLAEAVGGFSKNLFAFFGFRALEYLFIWGWTLLIVWEPLLVLGLRAFGLEAAGFSAVPAGIAVGECLLLWGIVVWRFKLPKSLLLVYPLAVIVFCAVALRSMVLTVRGGTSWKGRPLKRYRFRWF